MARFFLDSTSRYAIAKGEQSGNPVREVRKPAVRRKLEIVAIRPTQVESLRRALADDPAGQLLVTLIAYEGLRPEESVALTETRRRNSTRLFIGPRTMEYYLHKVFAKLDIRSRNELARVLPHG